MTVVPNATGRRIDVWMAAIVASWVVAAGAIGFILTRSYVEGGWDRIRHAASEFESPSGWVDEGGGEWGTYWCVISCLEPTVRRTYFTAATPEQACDAAREAVGAQIGPVVPDLGRAACGPWSAALGDGARVTAQSCPALTPEELAADQFAQGVGPPYCRQGAGFSPAGTYVWVDFASGID